MPVSPEYVKEAAASYSGQVSYPVKDRGAVFTFAFFSPKHLGQGQFYLMTIKDKDAQSFNGGDTSRLTVPANAPFKRYRSATMYVRTPTR